MPEAHAPSAEAVLDKTLPSGRSLTITSAGDEDRIAIAGPDGALECVVTFGPEGPVVRVAARRVEVEAAESIAFEAPEINLKATREASVVSEGDLVLRGAMVYIN